MHSILEYYFVCCFVNCEGKCCHTDRIPVCRVSTHEDARATKPIMSRSNPAGQPVSLTLSFSRDTRSQRIEENSLHCLVVCCLPNPKFSSSSLCVRFFIHHTRVAKSITHVYLQLFFFILFLPLIHCALFFFWYWSCARARTMYIHTRCKKVATHRNKLTTTNLQSYSCRWTVKTCKQNINQ